MELKKYLRLVACTGDDGDDYTLVEISNRRAREAADRIEKLEAALRKIMNLGQSAVPDHWEARCLARDTARKALEGKDD
jgi:hypothetical protein